MGEQLNFVLTTIANAPDGISAADVAEELGMGFARVQYHIDDLEEECLVEEEDDVYAATTEGRAQVVENNLDIRLNEYRTALEQGGSG